MKIRRRGVFAGSSILAAVFALALSGCGAEEAADKAASKAAAKASDAITAAECKLASKDVLNEALGTTYADPKASKDGSATLCTYKDANGSTATLRIEHSSSAESFAARKSEAPSKGFTTAGISGVGDEAYATTARPDPQTTVNGVVARKGPVEVWLQTPSTVDKNKLQDFVKQLLG